MCIINCIKNMWFLLVGNTCIPVADSFWYLAKLIQLCKLKKKKLRKNQILQSGWRRKNNHDVFIAAIFHMQLGKLFLRSFKLRRPLFKLRSGVKFKFSFQDFPSGPVTRTLWSQNRGPGFHFWSMNYI